MDQAFFPSDYAQSRSHFRAFLPLIQQVYPQADWFIHPLKDHPDLTQDWIYADTPAAKRLVMLSSGEHGIEGYVGAAVLDLFVREYLTRLDPASTSLLLFHAINPDGMRRRRRFNAHNVDINRNFISDWQGKQAVNPEYDRLLDILQPARPLRGWALDNLRFYAGVAASIARVGLTGSREAVLRGQYRHPKGIYFGGTQLEEETAVFMDLQRSLLRRYDQIVHIDLHTGYGPRHQMSIVNASSGPFTSAECVRNFAYPLVVRTDPSEFYTIYGDLTEFWYELLPDFPGKQVFSTAFEFGTFGDSLPASIRSLRATILENQLFWHGGEKTAAAAVRAEYEELFYPSDPAWRAKALQDARLALDGILSHFGYL